MSIISFDSSHNSKPKHHSMKEFISCVGEYIRARTEESASLINRHLQLLSVSIDNSIFDPNTSVVCEFFVSLHELLNSLEPRSTLAWCCINVLSIACKNASARHQLTHTYQFIPALSRLLGDHLNPEKKVRLLQVMQELSWGLKISWQIPHLNNLMSTLTKWIENESQTEQVTMLALGVLVNLCYNNLPAIYTLSRCVDIKNFLKVCLRLKGATMEVNVCKLLIILDHNHGVVPEDAYLKLINVTFESVKEAFEANDAILLRHVVEFFLDVKNQNDKTEINNYEFITAKCENYHIEVEKLLNVVDNNASGDGSSNDPECLSLIFKFLHSLIEMKLPKLVHLHHKIVQLALRWIQTEMACSEALCILKTVAVNSNLEDSKILEPLLNGVPIFALSIQNIEEDVIMNIEHCKRLSSVMQLFRSFIRAEHTRARLMPCLDEQNLFKIFVPLLGNNSPRSGAGDANNCTPEAVSLYINTLVLITELAKYSTAWVQPLTTLLQHRQIHLILAEALYNGSQEIKTVILSMPAFSKFPCSEVAMAMSELQPLVKSETQNSNNSNMQANLMSYPIMSIAQSERLDETINNLKQACSNVGSIATSDVMELYEYKLASMGHAERAAMASVDAASQRCIHLQHQTAQLTAEISRTRQLLIHTQQRIEEINKINKGLDQCTREYKHRIDVLKGHLKLAQSQLKEKEKILQQKTEDLENITTRLNERNEILAKVEESLKLQQKNGEKKDDLIKNANLSIEKFKLQVIQLEIQVKQAESELKTRNNELLKVRSELAEKTNLINTITRLTNSNK